MKFIKENDFDVLELRWGPFPFLVFSDSVEFIFFSPHATDEISDGQVISSTKTKLKTVIQIQLHIKCRS